MLTRLASWVVGPELLWLFFYAALVFIAKATRSPVKSMDEHWVRLAWLVPFLLVPLGFGLFFPDFNVNSGLLLRLWIASAVGAHYVLDKGLGLHTEQGPGVGTAYIFGMLFVFVSLTAGSICVYLRY